MPLERRYKSAPASPRSAIALLLGLFIPIACAQGTEEPLPDDGDLQTAGNGSGSAGNGSAGKSAGSAGSAGKASGGAGAGAGGASAGAGGKPAAGGGGTGGKGGTSGAGGSAGKAGGATGGAPQGGSSGAPAGGNTGTAGGPTGTAGSSSVAGFSVQYKNLKTAASSPYIECQVLAKNSGPNTLSVADLKLRYYFTDEVKKAPQFQNNFQHINISGSQAGLNVTQKVVGMAPTTSTADTFIEFSFTSPSHTTLSPGEALEFAWQMQGPDPSKDVFTQGNDYSWDAGKTAFADWDHLVLLQGNSPLWGITPK